MYRKLIWPLVLIISILGFWFPLLGLLMYPMLFAIMILALFRGRYWCGNVCPRGALLDIPLLKIKGKSKNKSLPKFFNNILFKIVVLILLMGFFMLNTVKAFAYWDEAWFWERLGMVGVNMCAITTVAALILGFAIHHRAWCSFCPMGTVQSTLYKTKKKIIRKRKTKNS